MKETVNDGITTNKDKAGEVISHSTATKPFDAARKKKKKAAPAPDSKTKE